LSKSKHGEKESKKRQSKFSKRQSKFSIKKHVENGIDEIFFCILMCFIEKFYCKNFDRSHYGYVRNKIQVFYGRYHAYFFFFWFSKCSQLLLLKNWVSQFIVKYKIKKSKKLNCHFENLDCRFPKNQRDFIIGSQIKRQFDFRFENLEKLEKTTRTTIIFSNWQFWFSIRRTKLSNRKIFGQIEKLSKRKSKLSIIF
jgi:hypothetical protein